MGRTYKSRNRRALQFQTRNRNRRASLTQSRNRRALQFQTRNRNRRASLTQSRNRRALLFQTLFQSCIRELLSTVTSESVPEPPKRGRGTPWGYLLKVWRHPPEKLLRLRPRGRPPERHLHRRPRGRPPECQLRLRHRSRPPKTLLRYRILGRPPGPLPCLRPDGGSPKTLLRPQPRGRPPEHLSRLRPSELEAQPEKSFVFSPDVLCCELEAQTQDCKAKPEAKCLASHELSYQPSPVPPPRHQATATGSNTHRDRTTQEKHTGGPACSQGPYASAANRRRAPRDPPKMPPRPKARPHPTKTNANSAQCNALRTESTQDQKSRPVPDRKKSRPQPPNRPQGTPAHQRLWQQGQTAGRTPAQTPSSTPHRTRTPETPPGPLPKGNAPQGSQTPGPTPDPPSSRARQCPKTPGAGTSTPTPTPAPERLPHDTCPTTPIRTRRKPHNTAKHISRAPLQAPIAPLTPPLPHTQKKLNKLKISPSLKKNGRKQASVQHQPPHREDPSYQTLLPRKINMPALPGDKQAAEQEPLRQRTAGTRGPERPQQKQHRKADIDEPTAPTKPPGGFPYPKTQRNHSAPTDHSKHSRKAPAAPVTKAALPTPLRPTGRREEDSCAGRGPPPPCSQTPSNPPLPNRARCTAPRATGTRPNRAKPHPRPGAFQRDPPTRTTSPQQTHTNPGHRRDHPYTPPRTTQPRQAPRPTTKTRHRKTRHVPRPCRAEAPRPAPQKNRCPAPSPVQQQHSYQASSPRPPPRDPPKALHAAAAGPPRGAPDSAPMGATVPGARPARHPTMSTPPSPQDPRTPELASAPHKTHPTAPHYTK
ncbi:nascent polypeptide-associated complex subunit alpha, muscle-specific form-like [Cyprinodon tularosa]|uniref:nascent polypeptide-associated complex subunit alpha, muscle-specific form-like n=1 Tax=Cyprinodon tularosa TaxID=77115 RepID=UPI0018E266DC|nr:nascent polypeptide-associated complex subunit alpha, muscle-specific form-like [Cyprinodon tularosa]